ncbi:glyoxalase [Roseinatronobacter alkalisoli]|uniref:Glyoxalase n=1 Tax=Roseinatronobacter alkalisoli TaxID=3028235 RepID=A0ABT5T434_9RHOB|nr:glyoxalase [Roseinatronobacter sp. HJB301]MDD7969804.1 glyoxalase [Roseinatronobacter sp. HJB301]
MDFDTVKPEVLGQSLTGIGVNLLCRDVLATVAFLQDVFGLRAYRAGADFAIVTHGQMILQLHSDGTYGAHPLLGVLPENPPRGAGVQIYLFGLDPDAAVARAAPNQVLEPPADKPHGLREATILSPDGYAFSPARPL